MLQKQHLIIVGTESGAGKGGISTALEGYIQGVQQLDIPHTLVVTHTGNEGSLTGIKRWFKQLTNLYRAIKTAQSKDQQVFVWIHPAAWLSSIRKITFALIARSLKARVIFHIHSHSTERYLNHTVLQILPRTILSLANEVFALTPWWQKRLQSIVPNKPVTIVPNPISEELTSILDSPRPERGNSSTINIVAMSRLVRGKGFEQVIKALPVLGKNYQLFIAGEGAIQEELSNLASSIEVSEQVHFTGWLASKEKFELLSKADVFCLPSKNDSFGMVFIEAMACRLPVVALDFGGVSDVVKHMNSGVLIDDDAPQAIAEGILLALEHKKQLVIGGIEHVKNNYTPNRVAQLVKHRMEAACHD